MSGRVPYRVGDRARVLHAGPDGGTRLGLLEVESVRVRVEGGVDVRCWWVRFAGLGYDVTVGSDGRDRHGYVEPVRP